MCKLSVTLTPTNVGHLKRWTRQELATTEFWFARFPNVKVRLDYQEIDGSPWTINSKAEERLREKLAVLVTDDGKQTTVNGDLIVATSVAEGVRASNPRIWGLRVLRRLERECERLERRWPIPWSAWTEEIPDDQRS